MKQSPPTRPSLLVRLRDHKDENAWQQFLDIYAPLVHALARHRGLQDADAADLTQEVLQRVARSAKSFSYDPKRGSFRGWLLKVTQNQLHDFFARKHRQPLGSGDSQVGKMLQAVADPSCEEEYWNREHQWSLVRWAAEQVKAEFRENTWKAFVQTALEQKDPAVVASQLGASTGAVYIAKSRVLARVRQLIEDLGE